MIPIPNKAALDFLDGANEKARASGGVRRQTARHQTLDASGLG